MSEYHYRLSPRTQRVLKKIKDKSLLQKYRDTMRQVSRSPCAGNAKVGDLEGVYAVRFRETDGDHLVAYTVVQEGDVGPFVLILLVGTRENFYAELKRLWNR